MKALINLQNRQIEVEGNTQKELFAQMASTYEVFGEKKCGCCDSDDIKPAVRKVPDGKKVHEYYEYICNKCGAKLQLGQSTDTETLFPKRKLDKDGKPDMENGKYGKHNGWSHEWKNHVKKES